VKRFTARDLPYMEAARHALVDGFEAFVTGEPMSANSHDPAKCPVAYAAWRTGWLEAQAASKSAETLISRASQRPMIEGGLSPVPMAQTTGDASSPPAVPLILRHSLS